MLAEIGSLGEETPNHAVVVFVGSLFPCGEAVAVPDIKSGAAIDRLPKQLVLKKFTAIICGNASEPLPKIRRCPFYPVDSLSYGLCFSIWQLHDDFRSGDPLCQRQQNRVGILLAYNQVHLPVSALRALLNMLRSVRNTRKSRMCNPAELFAAFSLPLSLVKQMLIGQPLKYTIFNIAIEGCCANRYRESPSLLAAAELPQGSTAFG